MTEKCPKCGVEAEWSGLLWVGADFGRPHDALMFTCPNCRYRRYEPPKDAPDSRPPWRPDVPDDIGGFSGERLSWRLFFPWLRPKS